MGFITYVKIKCMTPGNEDWEEKNGSILLQSSHM